jgi:hypothetical protein
LNPRDARLLNAGGAPRADRRDTPLTVERSGDKFVRAAITESADLVLALGGYFTKAGAGFRVLYFSLLAATWVAALALLLSDKLRKLMTLPGGGGRP